MNQEQFIASHEASWQQLEAWLEKTATGTRTAPPRGDFASLYRQTCQHLALARSRLYSHQLINRLNRLVVLGHQRLYGNQRHFGHDMARYLLADFPAAVRARWKLVLTSALLFYLPLVGMLVAIQVDPDMVYTVLDGGSLRQIETMYDPASPERVGRTAERAADSDLMMFGFYIKNNTGIGFQTFAGGLLLGLGSLFYIIFNGIYIGAIAGHLTQLGFIETFWGFVAGHSALELNAIVLSGAAGLQLGMALIAPGRRTRLRALREETLGALYIMYGTAGMFILAAMVEAFWSSSPLFSPMVKYAVGLGLWLMVLIYFLFAGRHATR